MKQQIPKKSAAITAGLSFLAAILLAIGFGSTTAQAASADTVLTFTDTAVTASGENAGVEIDGTDLTITASGTYTLTGSCADGSVTVKKGTSGVTLILDGLSLTSSDSAPLRCNKDTEVTLRVTGTNTLTDAEDIANEGSEDFDGAAVKVKSGASLTVTGDGTLTVNGSCKNGIKGAGLAAVTIDSSTLIVHAENNGIACDNAIVINGGSVTVTAGNDGIKAEPDEDDADSAGSIAITGGTVKITSAGDSVQTAGDLTITGGTFDVTSGDDAFKSAGNITVTAGTFRIAAEDDGISADYILTVGTKNASSGPDITISKCTEGLEGAAVNLYAGKAAITSSDDGINAANGDLTDYDYVINVTGGSWTVNAGGDAMDSNGDINISAGLVELFGAPNNGNNALDYAKICTVSGGTLFTVDCTGMNQVPSYGTYVVFGKTAGAGFGGQMPQMGENGELPTPPDGMTPPDFSGSNADGQNGQRPAPPEGMTPPDLSGGSAGGQGGQRPAPPNGQNEEMPAPPDGMTPPDFSNGSADGQTPGGPGGQTVDTSTINIQSGSRIEVKDSNGRTLYSATGTKTANCVMLSSEALTAGETYTLYIDGEAVATAEAQEGTGQSGFDPGGQPGQTTGRQDRTQTSAGYSDVADSAWYADAVNYVTEKGMMNGTGNETFSPNGETTRAMVVTILYRLEGSPEVGESSYHDVQKTAWYAKAVAWAEENGIVNGTGSGTFSPEQPVTRQQLAAILYRYAQYKGFDVSQVGDLSGYSDQGKIQSYARDAMQWACGAKLIQGVDGSTLSPAGTATRAQVAAILQRLCETAAK